MSELKVGQKVKHPSYAVTATVAALYTYPIVGIPCAVIRWTHPMRGAVQMHCRVKDLATA